MMARFQMFTELVWILMDISCSTFALICGFYQSVTVNQLTRFPLKDSRSSTVRSYKLG